LGVKIRTFFRNKAAFFVIFWAMAVVYFIAKLNKPQKQVLYLCFVPKNKQFMKIKQSFAFAAAMLISYCAVAQKNINFLVKDSASQTTIIGATVLETGTNNGAVTNEVGIVSLPITHTGNMRCSIQALGFVTKNIIVKTNTPDTLITIFLAPDNQNLDEITVTSSRTNSRIEDIPTRIEVLGLEDLQEENGVKPGNIMSLLGDIAGLQMQQVSAASGNTLTRIQGLNGRYTQLLKDGMPLFGGLAGNFGIMQIPPADLKQIEIIKGSAATLYGGDAIGGIINLISKEPAYAPEMNITVNGSSLGEVNANIYYAKRNKNTGITLFAGQTIQQPMDIDKDGLSDSPSVITTILHPKFSWYIDPKSTLTLNYTYTRDIHEGGNMQYFSTDVTDTIYHIKNTMQRHTADAKYRYDFENKSKLTIKVSGNLVDQTLNTNAYIFAAKQTNYFSEISYFMTNNNSSWVFGANLNGETFTNEMPSLPNIKNYIYQTTGLFAQNTWLPVPKLTIETGLRADILSNYGALWLPRLSFLYKLNSHFSARLNGGYGYKRPTVLSYINPETDLDKVKTGLEPAAEISQSANADLNYTRLIGNKLNITINQSFFFTNLNYPAVATEQTNNIITFVNADKPIQTKGLQTYTRLHYAPMELYLSYVYTDVTKLYDETHPFLTVTPRHNISSTFFYEVGEQWRAGVEASFIAGQLKQDYSPAPNYVLAAAMVQFKTQKFTFVLNAENLFDIRQSRFGRIYSGSIYKPIYQQLYAPIDGRVFNVSVQYRL
jgi:outer membrane receptor for ferrienterochelin and colicins